MGFVVSLLGGVRATVFAALAALLVVGLGIQTWRLKDATADLATKTAEVTIANASIGTLKTSNASKDSANRDLTTRLTEAVGQKQAVDEARAAAIAELTAARSARDAALADAKKLRGRLYAQDKASREWAALPTSRGITVGVLDAWAAASGDDGSGNRSAGPPVRGDSAGSRPASSAAATAAAGLQDCRDGCFSDGQLLDALTGALDTLGRCYDQLDAIATLSAKAKDSNPAKSGESNNGDETGLPAHEARRTETAPGEEGQSTAAP